MKCFRMSLPIVLVALIFGTAATVPSASAQEEASWRVLMQTSYEEVDTPEGRGWLPRFTDEVEQLDGRRVRLAGYMIPLGYEEEQMHFLISAFPGHGCFFHMPGGPESIVEVQAAKPITFTYDPIAVEGRLELLRDDPYGLLYRMVDARSAP